MALTKQQISDLISTNLQTGSKITAIKHKEVENTIVDAIFELRTETESDFSTVNNTTGSLSQQIIALSATIASLSATVSSLTAKLPYNNGVVRDISIDSGIENGSVATGGDIVSCILNDKDGSGNIYTVTLTNAMPTTNFSVFFALESKGTNMLDDNNAMSVVFKPLSPTTFQFSLDDVTGTGGDLIDLHLKVYNNSYT
jgi:hypothetical protein